MQLPTATMRLPISVPILTAKDMAHGAYCNKRGCMCLVGRFCAVFFGWQANADNPPGIAMECSSHKTYSAFKKFVTKHRHAPVNGWFVVRVNDLISRDKAAEIWNEFVASLGYTEITKG